MIPEDYIPFGDEWKKELKKTPKDFLIDQLRTALMKIQEMENAPHQFATYHCHDCGTICSKHESGLCFSCWKKLGIVIPKIKQ